MKNLDLNNYGVQEMNAGEMTVNNGGFFAIADFFRVEFCDFGGAGWGPAYS
jgi:hypothetical protein